MAKPKFKNDSPTREIINIYGTVKENDTHDWITAVMRIIWNDNPATVDIRKCNLANDRMGKGISLSNEETDKLVDILLQNDFGSIEELEKAINKRKSIYTPIESVGTQNKYIIEIKYKEDD